MPVNFSKTVEFEPVDTGELAALRLEAELARLFAKGSQYAEMRLNKVPWVITDADASTAKGKTVREAFAEFEGHGLTPNRIRTRKMVVSGPLGETSVAFDVRYSLSRNNVEIDLWGADRITVDGVAAFCERIGERMQKPLDPEEQRALESPTEKVTWLSRSWKDHAAMLVIAIVGPLIVALLLLWFGLSK